MHIYRLTIHDYIKLSCASHLTPLYISIHYAHAHNNTHNSPLNHHQQYTYIHTYIHTYTHTSLIQTINTSTTTHTHYNYIPKKGRKQERKNISEKGDIGIREKAHKQDTSQTQQPHSTIVTSAPTSPFQHKSTLNHYVSHSKHASLPTTPLPSETGNHSYSNKITIQIFNNNYDSVCMH